MRIIKCYINNFGKLSDFSYDFDSKISLINEENGFGKSTLCAFLKAMFYGFNNTRSKTLDENERKKFTPWQGGVYGGSLEFSCEKGEYRIERTFGEKQSLDTYRLINTKNGKESKDFTENIGEELFGIDLKGFERCVYLGSELSADKMPVSVVSRLLGTDDSDGLGGYEKALQTLQKRSKQYKTIGDKGIIPDKEREIASIQNDIDISLNAKVQAEDLKNKKTRLEGRKFVIYKELENTRALISENASIEVIKEKIKHYNSLVASAKGAKANYEKISDKYNGKLPSEKEFERLTHLCEKLNELKNNDERVNLEYLKKRRIVFSVVSGFLWIAAAVLFLIAFLFEFQSTLLFSAGTLVILIDAFVGIYLKIDKNRKEKASALLIDDNEKELNELLSNIGVEQGERSFEDVLAELKSDLSQYNIEKAKFDEYYALAKDYYNEEKLESVKEDMASKTPEELKKKEKSLVSDFDLVSAEVLKYEAQIEKLTETADEYADLIYKKQVAENQVETYNANYHALLKGIELLQKSKETLLSKYKQKIEHNFKNYLIKLTDGSISEAILSDVFEISVYDSGFSRDIESYSSGTKAIIEIALRLAVMDSLFEKEKGFVILDDPFVHLDDKTFVNITEKVRDLSENIQILYFTCTKNRTF